jgi:hypothetical protein
MPFKSEKQRKWMWANDPEMAEKWEKEEKNESRNIRVTENELRSIVRRTLLSEQDITAAIKMLMGSLDDNQRAELAASMSDPSKPTGPSGPSGPKEEEAEAMPAPEIEELLDDPDKQDDALDAISQDPSAMANMVADNPEAVEDAVGANPDMLQGFLEDPSIMDKLEGMLAGSDFLKGMIGKVGGPEAAAALGELGENTVRLTRRQLRQIIKEGIDVMNSETGELLVFEDDWETEGGAAPEAAAREIMKRLGVAQISSEINGDIEDIEIKPEDWARMQVEIQGKRHYRKNKRERERLDIDNLLARADQWAVDASGDYGADNPSIDMQDASWDLAAGAKYEFREDEWDELIWHFDNSEDELVTYIADRIAG